MKRSIAAELDRETSSAMYIDTTTTTIPSQHQHAARRAATIVQPTLSEALASVVDNPKLSDVRFLAGEDAEPVYASKAILASRSPVFAALLAGGFREGQPEPTSSSSSSSAAAKLWHNVEMPDVEPHVLRHLLHWCYTDTLHPDLVWPLAKGSLEAEESIANGLVHLYAVADRHLLPLCARCVEEHLAGHDTLQIALPLFDSASWAAPKLAEFILDRLIAPHGGALLSGQQPEREEQWLSLSSNAVRALIASEALCGIDELNLFLAVVRWAEHEHKFSGDGMTTAADLAAPLLEHIKFGLINASSLARVERSGLLSPEKLLEVYKDSARFTSSVIPDVRSVLVRGSVLVLDGVVGCRHLQWAVSFDNALRPALRVFLDVTPLTTSGSPVRGGKVHLNGIRFYLYVGRRLVRRGFFTADHHLPVSGRVQLCELDLSECDHETAVRALTVRVLVPRQALARVRQSTNSARARADTYSTS